MTKSELLKNPAIVKRNNRIALIATSAMVVVFTVWGFMIAT